MTWWGKLGRRISLHNGPRRKRRDSPASTPRTVPFWYEKTSSLTDRSAVEVVATLAQVLKLSNRCCLDRDGVASSSSW